MEDCIRLPAETTSEKVCSNQGKFLRKQINLAIALERVTCNDDGTLTIVLGPFKEVCPLCGKTHY